MREGLALTLLGLVALMVQSVAALSVSAWYLPDLGLALVMAIALRVRSAAAGLILAALLGYATDLLSGSLLGQHTLLRIGAFGATRYGGARISLRGFLPQVLFGTLLAVGYAAALWGLVAFFSPQSGAPIGHLSELLPHAVVTGLAAPFMSTAVGAVLGWLGEDESAQRLLPYEPRNFSA